MKLQILAAAALALLSAVPGVVSEKPSTAVARPVENFEDVIASVGLYDEEEDSTFDSEDLIAKGGKGKGRSNHRSSRRRRRRRSSSRRRSSRRRRRSSSRRRRGARRNMCRRPSGSDRRLCRELEDTLCSGRQRRDNRSFCREIGIRSLEDEDFVAVDDGPLPQEYQDLIDDIADELEDSYGDSDSDSNSNDSSDYSYDDSEDESFDSYETQDSEDDLELASEDWIPGRQNTPSCRGRGCQANGRNWRENRHSRGYWGRRGRQAARRSGCRRGRDFRGWRCSEEQVVMMAEMMNSPEMEDSSDYDYEDFVSYETGDSEDLELASEDRVPRRQNTRSCRGRGCQANGRNWRENRHRRGYWGAQGRRAARNSGCRRGRDFRGWRCSEEQVAMMAEMMTTPLEDSEDFYDYYE